MQYPGGAIVPPWTRSGKLTPHLHMTLEQCPRCSNPLGAPLRSGRQVCMKCAWSDRPRQEAGSEPAPRRYRSDASVDSPPPSDPEAPFDAPSPHRQGSSTRQDRRALSLILHGSLFFSSTGASLILPIVLLIVSKDWVTKSNAKEVLNFQISLFLYGFIILGFVILFNGASWFYLFIPLLIMTFVLPILAIINSIQDPDNPYIYPFIIHVLT